MLESEAVRTLYHAAFRVLVLLAAEYNGHNCGAQGITAKQAYEHGISRNAFYAALQELQARGLIHMTCKASRIPPRPAKFELAWVARDDTEFSQSRRLPTHAYKQWRAAKEAS
ncbi:MAG TPA: hypothetical protein VFL54_06775 [Gammaproteobacteria bacterium]|nr:hypothetical protein [Gammaproteobacteria bacterium]